MQLQLQLQRQHDESLQSFPLLYICSMQTTTKCESINIALTQETNLSLKSQRNNRTKNERNKKKKKKKKMCVSNEKRYQTLDQRFY